MICFSWETIGDFCAIKHCDKSVFVHNGSGIPIEIRQFWNVDNLDYSEKRNIELIYNDKIYQAHIKRDSKKAKGRTRIYWYADLARELKCYKNSYQSEKLYLRFIKINTESNTYYVSLENEVIHDQVREDSGNYSLESYVEIKSTKKEGKRIAIYTTKYERNPINRENAIKSHGLQCQVCGFNFEETYGEIGKGFIEVHHKRPLYSVDEQIEVDPVNDLACLCSNCHSMIHRKRNEILSVEELIAIVRRTKSKQYLE